MHQWEYCYTIKGYVMYCTADGDRTVRLDECQRTEGQGSVSVEACIVAELGRQEWEAFAVDPASRVWFKRPKRG